MNEKHELLKIIGGVTISFHIRERAKYCIDCAECSTCKYHKYEKIK